MMSPYEGERIFEAEMVRLHQCDRTLYSCTPQRSAGIAPRPSLWQRFVGAGAHIFAGQTDAPHNSSHLSPRS